MKRKIKNIYLIFCFLFTDVTVGICQFNSIYTATNTENIGGTLTLLNNFLYGYSWVGAGSIYYISTSGTGFKNLFTFIGTNGYEPVGSLAPSINGDTIFGMTGLGGPLWSLHFSGYGTIFSIKTDGSDFNKIYNFNDTNGANPYGGLILSGSTLYGMTYLGGAYNKGVIFSVHTDGTEYKDMLDFDSINGARPQGSLTISVTGDTLFGMTQRGGADDNGCIFFIHTDGTGYQHLFDFTNTNSNGGNPTGNLILSGNKLW